MSCKKPSKPGGGGGGSVLRPFVAANLDKRSDSVRVILKLQSVNVPTQPETQGR